MSATTEQLTITEPNGKPLIEVKEELAITPLTLLDRAMQKGLPPETLKQFMDFVERVDAMEARKAFVRSMNQFKANPPEITRNKTADAGKYKYRYATLDHVCDEITGALGAVGISHRFETEQKDKLISVTCVLTHEKGHSERTTLQGLPDDSGGKNAIQAVGSTVSYLQRYTLLAATGLAASNDDDGAGGFILDSMDARLKEIADAPDARALMSVYKTHYEAALGKKDSKAMLAVIEAKDKRKAQLNEHA